MRNMQVRILCPQPLPFILPFRLCFCGRSAMMEACDVQSATAPTPGKTTFGTAAIDAPLHQLLRSILNVVISNMTATGTALDVDSTTTHTISEQNAHITIMQTMVGVLAVVRTMGGTIWICFSYLPACIQVGLNTGTSFGSIPSAS